MQEGRENESENLVPLQGWLLKLLRKNLSVLFVHYAENRRNQCEASKKEDVLNTVIVLCKQNDYDLREGAK